MLRLIYLERFFAGPAPLPWPSMLGEPRSRARPGADQRLGVKMKSKPGIPTLGGMDKSTGHSWEGLTSCILCTKEQVKTLMATWISWRSRGEDSKDDERSKKHGFNAILGGKIIYRWMKTEDTKIAVNCEENWSRMLNYSKIDLRY